MSLIDELKKQLGGILSTDETLAGGETPTPSALVDNVFGMIKSQGLGNLVDQFSKNGLGDVIGSWVGKGANLPIHPDQIKAALGTESLQVLAGKLGLPLENVSSLLSKILPGVVDQLTPQGAVDEVSIAAFESTETSEWQQPLSN